MQYSKLFNKDLQCYVFSVSYDFNERKGVIYVGGPTDMKGCVDFFLRIDPHVQHIQTVLDGGRDTAYWRAEKDVAPGKWPWLAQRIRSTDEERKVYAEAYAAVLRALDASGASDPVVWRRNRRFRLLTPPEQDRF